MASNMNKIYKGKSCEMAYKFDRNFIQITLVDVRFVSLADILEGHELRPLYPRKRTSIHSG